MKTLFLLALLALPNLSHAARMGSPFPPEIDKRFDNLENDIAENSDTARKYAKLTYEPAIDGGASGSTNSLGVRLPAGALITAVYFVVDEAFTEGGGGAGRGSVAFQCAGTRELLEYQDLAAWPVAGYVARGLGHAAAIGYPAATLVQETVVPSIQGLGSSVSANCTVKAIVRGDSGYESYTAGKATLILEYFNTN